jgi:hypothetical protein
VSDAPGPIVHRELCLLVLDSPELVAELRASAGLDQLVLAWLDPVRALVDPARITELSARLGARGAAPLVRRARPDGDQGSR